MNEKVYIYKEMGIKTVSVCLLNEITGKKGIFDLKGLSSFNKLLKSSFQV